MIYINVAYFDTWKCIGVLKPRGKLPPLKELRGALSTNQRTLERFLIFGQIHYPCSRH